MYSNHPIFLNWLNDFAIFNINILIIFFVYDSNYFKLISKATKFINIETTFEVLVEEIYNANMLQFWNISEWILTKS